MSKSDENTGKQAIYRRCQPSFLIRRSQVRILSGVLAEISPINGLERIFSVIVITTSGMVFSAVLPKNLGMADLDNADGLSFARMAALFPGVAIGSLGLVIAPT